MVDDMQQRSVAGLKQETLGVHIERFRPLGQRFSVVFQPRTPYKIL